MPDLSDAGLEALDTETAAWFARVLETIETLDAAAYAALMSADVELRLPTGTMLTGRAEVAEVLGAEWADVSSLVHHERNVEGTATQVVHEARTVTTTAAGDVSTAYTTAWIERGTDGLITSARVYG